MTIDFQYLTTIRYGEQGIGWACADPGGGGGEGRGRGSGPNRKITRYMSKSISKLLPPLTKFPGSAHGGGGFISLECIRTDCLNGEPGSGVGGGGDSITARGLGLAENDGFHMA